MMNTAKTNIFGPSFFTSHFLNPPEIEKILDTTLTKESQRFYKVKWVKVTWEAEDDLAHFSNVVDQFWAQYTRECLLEPENVEIGNFGKQGTMENSSQFSSSLSKDVYSFITVPSKISESATTSSLFLHGSSTDMLSMSSHSDLLSPQSSEEPPVEAATSEIPSPVINTSLFTESCKTLNQLSKEYHQYTLNNDIDEFPSSTLTEKLSDGEVTVSQSIIECKDSIEISNNLPNQDVVIDSNTSFNFTYKCSFCNATYQSKEKFLNHEKSHNERKCTICGKEFQRISHLKTHMNIHNNTRPFSCDLCSMSFKDKSSLTKHKLVHTNSRLHKCNFCEMSFNRAQHLRRHLESHKKVKHFECSQCGKKFNQKSALKVHINIHTGDKPFKCTVCQEAFSDGSTLRRHSFIHDKPFKCSMCSKTFSRESTLKNHISKIHCKE